MLNPLAAQSNLTPKIFVFILSILFISIIFPDILPDGNDERLLPKTTGYYILDTSLADSSRVIFIDIAIRVCDSNVKIRGWAIRVKEVSKSRANQETTSCLWSINKWTGNEEGNCQKGYLVFLLMIFWNILTRLQDILKINGISTNRTVVRDFKAEDPRFLRTVLKANDLRVTRRRHLSWTTIGKWSKLLTILEEDEKENAVCRCKQFSSLIVLTSVTDSWFDDDILTALLLRFFLVVFLDTVGVSPFFDVSVLMTELLNSLQEKIICCIKHQASGFFPSSKQ